MREKNVLIDTKNIRGKNDIPIDIKFPSESFPTVIFSSDYQLIFNLFFGLFSISWLALNSYPHNSEFSFGFHEKSYTKYSILKFFFILVFKWIKSENNLGNEVNNFFNGKSNPSSISTAGRVKHNYELNSQVILFLW